jgi:hypothetical protein
MALELVMYRGDDRDFDFTLTQDDVTVNLTGASIVFTGRLSTDFDGDLATDVLTLSTAGGHITLAADQAGAGKGMLTLTIPAESTVDLTTGTYLCDFEVTDVSGNVRTWPDAEYGQSTLIRLRLKKDATRP